ncbi:hypothetical protein D3C87_2071190 [compost metagenome]
MTARFEEASHDGDRELFATANQRSIDTVRTLAEQADTVQNMFDLSEFLLNKCF